MKQQLIQYIKCNDMLEMFIISPTPICKLIRRALDHFHNKKRNLNKERCSVSFIISTRALNNKEMFITSRSLFVSE